MRRQFAFAFAAGSALALNACALTFDSSRLGVPVTMANAARPTPPTGGIPFKVKRHPVFVFWGAATASAPNLEDVLAGQAGTGGAITDLRIKVRARWSDLLFTVLSFGVVSPRTVTFEGVVVTAPAPAPAQ